MFVLFWMAISRAWPKSGRREVLAGPLLLQRSLSPAGSKKAVSPLDMIRFENCLVQFIRARGMML
jgi:hypothetical protein